MKLRFFFVLILVLCIGSANAHVIDYELDRVSDGDVFWKYLVTGFDHIIPYGLDHILFILCVFFLNTKLKQIILQASMFTIAHSITLGLAMYGVISPPSNIVEPLIAVSILLLALENVYYYLKPEDKARMDKPRPWSMLLVFAFGLIHGMGFAGALSELGMPRYAFATALVSFNIGVELGQLAIILAMYFLVSKLFSKRPWYRKGLVMPISLIIALVAAYWTIERSFF